MNHIIEGTALQADCVRQVLVDENTRTPVLQVDALLAAASIRGLSRELWSLTIQHYMIAEYTNQTFNFNLQWF